MQAATPLAAVFQFFVRDLAGMFGGVLFAFVQAGWLNALLFADFDALFSLILCSLSFKMGDEAQSCVTAMQGSDLDIYAKQV